MTHRSEKSLDRSLELIIDDIYGDPYKPYRPPAPALPSGLYTSNK